MRVFSVDKTVRVFRELRRTVTGDRALMVGDQLDRDIYCAGDAGFETFYFPSNAILEY